MTMGLYYRESFYFDMHSGTFLFTPKEDEYVHIYRYGDDEEDDHPAVPLLIGSTTVLFS